MLSPLITFGPFLPLPPPSAQNAIVKNGITNSGNTSIIFFVFVFTVFIFIFCFVLNTFLPVRASNPQARAVSFHRCCPYIFYTPLFVKKFHRVSFHYIDLRAFHKQVAPHGYDQFLWWNAVCKR